jgi:hypothetical protein
MNSEEQRAKEYCVSAKPDTAHASPKHDKENK